MFLLLSFETTLQFFNKQIASQDKTELRSRPLTQVLDTRSGFSRCNEGCIQTRQCTRQDYFPFPTILCVLMDISQTISLYS